MFVHRTFWMWTSGRFRVDVTIGLDPKACIALKVLSTTLPSLGRRLMPERMYVLRDGESGVPVGLHVVATDLDISDDEVAQVAAGVGKERLRVEAMAVDQLISPAGAGGEGSFGGGGTGHPADVAGIPRRYERIPPPERRIQST